jgi:hypothetical protein
MTPLEELVRNTLTAQAQQAPRPTQATTSIDAITQRRSRSSWTTPLLAAAASALVVVGLVLVANRPHDVPATSPTGIPTANTTGSTACLQHQLQIHLGRTGGAAGSSYVPIVFRNTSAQSCTLSGYPSVVFTLVSPSGTLAALHNPVGSSKTLVVDPGKRVHATVAITNPDNYMTSTNPASSTCGLVHAAAMTVQVGSGTGAAVLAFSSDMCQNKNGRPTVTPYAKHGH